MKERPILFNGPMVRALLAGTKTQTRQVVKPEGAHNLFQFRGTTAAAGADEPTGEWGWCGSERVVNKHIHCPYGKPGDRLWVRETFRGCRAYEVQGYAPKDWGNKPIWFEADGTPPGRPEQWALRSRPSIHMPRWASRITLEVTGVRVETLGIISHEDALAEGVSSIEEYKALWININGAWLPETWVWVVDFRMVLN